MMNDSNNKNLNITACDSEKKQQHKKRLLCAIIGSVFFFVVVVAVGRVRFLFTVTRKSENKKKTKQNKKRTRAPRTFPVRSSLLAPLPFFLATFTVPPPPPSPQKKRCRITDGEEKQIEKKIGNIHPRRRPNSASAIIVVPGAVSFRVVIYKPRARAHTHTHTLTHTHTRARAVPRQTAL